MATVSLNKVILPTIHELRMLKAIIHKDCINIS